jgi:hypothetical protein
VIGLYQPEAIGQRRYLPHTSRGVQTVSFLKPLYKITNILRGTSAVLDLNLSSPNLGQGKIFSYCNACTATTIGSSGHE